MVGSSIPVSRRTLSALATPLLLATACLRQPGVPQTPPPGVRSNAATPNRANTQAFEAAVVALIDSAAAMTAVLRGDARFAKLTIDPRPLASAPSGSDRGSDVRFLVSQDLVGDTAAVPARADVLAR